MDQRLRFLLLHSQRARRALYHLQLRTAFLLVLKNYQQTLQKKLFNYRHPNLSLKIVFSIITSYIYAQIISYLPTAAMVRGSLHSHLHHEPRLGNHNLEKIKAIKYATLRRPVAHKTFPVVTLIIDLSGYSRRHRCIFINDIDYTASGIKRRNALVRFNITESRRANSSSLNSSLSASNCCC